MCIIINNQEKNSYVKKQITKALVDLLNEKSLSNITVSELTKAAGVGRASFYRNYGTVSEVLYRYDEELIKEWGKEYESNPNSTPFNVFESLFGHYRTYRDFYMLLYRNGLSDVILKTILGASGPSEEQTNGEAYIKAFIAYGIFGWVIEWIARGMQESPEEMSRALALAQSASQDTKGE